MTESPPGFAEGLLHGHNQTYETGAHMKKLLKWTSVVLLGIPVLVYLVWIIGNINNDELNPEVAELLKPPPVQLSEKDNAYFDTIGLAAPPGMEPHAWGAAWFAQAAANDLAFLEDKPDTPISLAGYPPNNKQIELPCSPKDAQSVCLEEIARDTAAAQTHLDREALLLQRFDALLDKSYREPYRENSFWSELPPRAPEFRAIRLAQIRFALEIEKGNDDAALNGWQKETTFVLRQIANSRTLIDAMVFTAALNRYQKLLADYIARHPQAARTRAKQLLALLEPFDRSAVSLRPAFETEAAVATRSLVSPKMSLASTSYADDGDSLASRIIKTLANPLFDRQATANELAARNLGYARIAVSEGESHQNAIAKMTAQQSLPTDETATIHYRNPVGKFILALSGAPDFSKYIYRNDDLIANKKLIAFALDLISRDVTSSEQIADEIKEKQAELKHPYTGETPNWDATKRTLGYANRGQDNGPNYAPLVIELPD